MRTFALPSSVMSVAMRYEFGFEVQGMPDEFGVLRDVGGREVEGVFGQSLWMIGDERGAEILRMFWETLWMIWYPFGI